jgi:penicillin-binding protein-related factor A (putative recombinase)
MKERDFQTEFGKRNKIIGVFELKFCKGKSLPFSALADHQEKALLAASSSSGLYHKISDFPVFAGSKVRFNRPKPFDCVYLSNMDAYVVIMWWVPRKKKMVYYIDIDDFINMRDQADRKSITEEMAHGYSCTEKSYLKK